VMEAMPSRLRLVLLKPLKVKSSKLELASLMGNEKKKKKKKKKSNGFINMADILSPAN